MTAYQKPCSHWVISQDAIWHNHIHVSVPEVSIRDTDDIFDMCIYSFSKASKHPWLLGQIWGFQYSYCCWSFPKISSDPSPFQRKLVSYTSPAKPSTDGPLHFYHSYFQCQSLLWPKHPHLIVGIHFSWSWLSTYRLSVLSFKLSRSLQHGVPKRIHHLSSQQASFVPVLRLYSHGLSTATAFQ